MDNGPPSPPPATGLTPRPRQQPPSPRQPLTRDLPLRRERTLRDVRLQRSPPEPGNDGERPGIGRGAPALGLTKPKTWGAGSVQTKPLLPVTERRPHEENLAGRRTRKGSQDDDKWTIAPDGGSAGREGRQFAVANVGNNGRIYLRPTVRPANQRYPQPNFVFPMTPPGTAGLEPFGLEKRRDLDLVPQLSCREWNPPYPPSSSAGPGRESSGEKQIKIRQRHRRAMSDSTLPDTSVVRESEPGAFKIVITQPGEERRPRTVEEGVMGRSPLLEVAIPTWKMGTPRFSVRGTPFIRGSSYAPTTEEPPSSSASLLYGTPDGTTPNGSRKASPFPGFRIRSPHPDPSGPLNPPTAHRLRATYMSSHVVIEPAMFDALTFKPDCDDRVLVRYSASGSVTAATPPRLVAEITSPSFVDYELLSDFFLAYRSFLEPSDLVRMLFARLRWALRRDDEVGTVVRVRTFVALRHWILNYFMDDFLADYAIRTTFCSLLNELVDELSQDLQARRVPLKILTELKKCWRRVCAQFWDGPYFDASLGPDIPILPGGVAGHRDPRLDPISWLEPDPGLPQLDNVSVPPSPCEDTSFYVDAASIGHIDAVVTGDRPATPENDLDDDMLERNMASPTSIASIDAVSCSFPTKSTRLAQPGANYAAAHPADPSSMYNADLVATTPRAVVGKRVRPNHAHRRNGSLSDSLRDHPTTTEQALFRNAELLLALSYAGSLVRGNILPPSQSFVQEVHVPRTGAGSRETTLFQPAPTELSKANTMASAMSGQGMKRLLGSVRRVLSNKVQSGSPAQESYINISPPGPRGVTTNRLPGNPVVPQGRGRQNSARPLVRIDLLGAEVADEFKRAVREDLEAGIEHSARGSQISAGNLEQPADTRPVSDMGITTGSQSIVIVDDTSLRSDYPFMAGALPISNPSVETFAAAFAPNGADPTPPTTPPSRPLGTPRRSSYILGQHFSQHSLPADPLPPFIPDMETLGQNPPPSEEHARPSMDAMKPSLHRPSLSSVGKHTRQASSRSYVSSRPRGHTRNASSASGIFPQPTIRSFDATTISGRSIDDSPEILAPRPLRVLRRRPGGDLRAVINVGDLDATGLKKSRSVGSLTTFTESMRSSSLRSPTADSGGYVEVVASDYSPGRAEAFSLGAVTEQNPKFHLSLFSTHSSKPVMRPSFEIEAQKLAQIPDDVDDDGGVESALLKLEGRYEKKSGARLSMDPSRCADVDISLIMELGRAAKNAPTTDEAQDHRHGPLVEEPRTHSTSSVPTTVTTRGGLLDVSGRQGHHNARSFLSDDSKASYSSRPLLECGLTDDGHSKRTVTLEWMDRSILQGPDEGHTTSDRRSAHDSQHPSFDFVMKTDSMDRILPGATMPPPDGPVRNSMEQSFLYVGSDNGSDLSSELSAEMLDYDGGDGMPSSSNIGVAVSTLPAHPLGEMQQSGARPPSPPMTLIQALHMSPETAYIPTLQDHQVWEKPLPLTPETTPTTTGVPYSQCPLPLPLDPTGTNEALRNAPKLEMTDPIADPTTGSDDKYAAHLPFILAFDSEVLAQQFTLVEKDALNEIDWRELIEMRWKNAEQNGANARSWVSFLRDTDARGVEVVIARFNIMVKWTVSEVVLTQDIEERARCIIKFIHIAAHCRRYRNFATMSQIAIALTSNEVGRLRKTWTMVPASDKRTLQELEALLSPIRNFYGMRGEMEGGGSAAADMGCIPFVGIYTHDLLFNAQKPSEIASSPATAPLVNFERCRTAAGVVKTLLRLLEASTLYTFQPVEGITERCLWMGALSDEEIRRRSNALE
ncbi:hypothetical protein BT67DRAFT_383146 [Trichocladium antarcticum]|uniref:Guanine nucleotide exchange factor LTE1 n=1 Tax=Trichocladium antarcticum TaxID=1450529 RepID=A0AAN6UHK1_9PEZI|nr:hypothetical protein BT67DRAFT_383146 [Trichocladium antarcticum]